MSLPLPSASITPTDLVLQANGLAIIYAGGTFGCIGQPLAPMPAATFLPRLDAEVAARFNIRCHSLPAPHIRDSSQLQASDWIALLTQIIQLQQQGFRHILLIHGTDTLAYTAAFLAEVLAGWPLQVVITGSQYPLLDINGFSFNQNSDALDNLTLAIQQLQQPAQGCYVVFAGQCWPAHTVQKIHTTDLQAFAGVAGLPPLQPLTIQPLTTRSEPNALIHALQYLRQLNIATYYALPLDWPQQARQLQQLLDSPALDALIILGLGAGNLAQSREIEQVLRVAAGRGILVVISTQVPFGGVDSRYAAGHWLQDLDVLHAGQLPVAAIYARLAWICCLSTNYQQRRHYWLQATTPD